MAHHYVFWAVREWFALLIRLHSLRKGVSGAKHLLLLCRSGPDYVTPTGRPLPSRSPLRIGPQRWLWDITADCETARTTLKRKEPPNPTKCPGAPALKRFSLWSRWPSAEDRAGRPYPRPRERWTLPTRVWAALLQLLAAPPRATDRLPAPESDAQQRESPQVPAVGPYACGNALPVLPCPRCAAHRYRTGGIASKGPCATSSELTSSSNYCRRHK